MIIVSNNKYKIHLHSHRRRRTDNIVQWRKEKKKTKKQAMVYQTLSRKRIIKNQQRRTQPKMGVHTGAPEEWVNNYCSTGGTNCVTHV